MHGGGATNFSNSQKKNNNRYIDNRKVYAKYLLHGDTDTIKEFIARIYIYTIIMEFCIEKCTDYADYDKW